jgi:hypothetical protein
MPCERQPSSNQRFPRDVPIVARQTDRPMEANAIKIRLVPILQPPTRCPPAQLPGAVYGDAFAQTTTSGLFAALRKRHDADRSLEKTAAFLVGPQ